MQGRSGQGRPGQGRAGQARSGQGRAGQVERGRAGLICLVLVRAGWGSCLEFAGALED